MLGEFARVVKEARPDWYLLENVPAVPDLKVEDYYWQRLDVDQGWYCHIRRLRHIQFGSINGHKLDVPRGDVPADAEAPALANDTRSFEELCRLQGLPEGFDVPSFTVEAKKQAVGNGVPLVMGRTLARAVRVAHSKRVPQGLFGPLERTPNYERLCKCGCGRAVRGGKKYDTPACRKRAQRERDNAREIIG